TILTFFPWEGITQGRQGGGMATDIAYAVPEGSLEFWRNRLATFGVGITGEGKRFGESFLSFEDPDGLPLTLVVPATPDERKPWETEEVRDAEATRGFHTVTLTLRSVAETARVLTDIFEYRLDGQEGNRYRYVTDAVKGASRVDLLEVPGAARAINAGGTIHHVAFRVKDENTLMQYRQKVV